MIVLGDQPMITPQVIAAVLDRVDGPRPAARATFAGAPGHPVAGERSLFAELAELSGDEGARALLERRRRPVACGICRRPPRDLEARSGPGTADRR